MVGRSNWCEDINAIAPPPIRSLNLNATKEYEAAVPRQFGTLHERMKYLIMLLNQHLEDVPHDVNVAIYDLETELSHYPTVSPPYGRRTYKCSK
jgi:hypothetical protein